VEIVFPTVFSPTAGISTENRVFIFRNAGFAATAGFSVTRFPDFDSFWHWMLPKAGGRPKTHQKVVQKGSFFTVFTVIYIETWPETSGFDPF